MHSKTENLWWNFGLVHVSSALCLGVALYWEAVQWPLALLAELARDRHKFLELFKSVWIIVYLEREGLLRNTMKPKSFLWCATIFSKVMVKILIERFWYNQNLGVHMHKIIDLGKFSDESLHRIPSERLIFCFCFFLCHSDKILVLACFFHKF